MMKPHLCITLFVVVKRLSYTLYIHRLCTFSSPHPLPRTPDKRFVILSPPSPDRRMPRYSPWRRPRFARCRQSPGAMVWFHARALPQRRASEQAHGGRTRRQRALQDGRGVRFSPLAAGRRKRRRGGPDAKAARLRFMAHSLDGLRHPGHGTGRSSGGDEEEPVLV